jgi:hypothetical protein
VRTSADDYGDTRGDKHWRDQDAQPGLRRFVRDQIDVAAMTDQGIDAGAGSAHQRNTDDTKGNRGIPAHVTRSVLARLVLRIIDEGGDCPDTCADQESVPQRITVPVHLPNASFINSPWSAADVDDQRGRRHVDDFAFRFISGVVEHENRITALQPFRQI